MLHLASLFSIFVLVNARIPGVYTGGSWETAHATFYGGSDASGTMDTKKGTAISQLICPPAFVLKKEITL
ncbi:hypothetical protein GOBAR_DD06950 [Gossypium barbadense]|nr:hypothetical protein GOBAR_DD06950 [Gossypium barbadense]